MNKKLLILVLLLMGLSSCASTQTTRDKSVSGKPLWIKSPMEFCGNNEICAVGSGNPPARAKADARAGIMKWFKSNIKSSSRFSESAGGDGLSSSASVEIWEGADGILKGVEIKENFEEAKGRHYSLAGFDKVAAAASIRHNIGQLDDKMKVLYGDNTKKSAKTLLNYYKAREELNEQYLFLSNSSIPEAVTYAQVINNIRSKIPTGLTYHVNIYDVHDVDSSRQVTATIKETLTSVGNKVSQDDYSSNRRITGSLEAVRLYLNVEGFYKYQYVLKLDCVYDGIVINSIATEETREGRSRQQTFESALPKLKAYVQENIYDLIWQ